jgi:hypothetical protein
MIGNFRILSPNVLDDASIGVSPAAEPLLPVAYLQDPGRSRLWRSTSTALQTIIGDFPEPVSISGFNLYRHNLTSDATLRLRFFSATGLGGNLLFDSQPMAIQGSGAGTIIRKGWGEFAWGPDPWGGGNVFLGWATAYTSAWLDALIVQIRSFSLEVSDASNPAGFLQASRMSLGNYFSPRKNISWGMEFGWDDNSTQYRTDGGSLRTDPRESYRKWSLKMAHLADDERERLTEVLRLAGKRKDMFISIYPGAGGDKERNFSGQVKIVDPLPRFRYTRHENSEIEMHFEET